MIERYKCDAEMKSDLIQLHLWMVKGVLDDPNSLKENYDFSTLRNRVSKTIK